MKKLSLFFLFSILFFNLSAQDFKFGNVSKEEVEETVHPKDSEANAAVLFRSHRVSYEVNKHTGLSVVTEVHERVKIYNKDGFDWANKEILYYKDGNSRENVTGIKGYTYNLRNGKLDKEKLRKSGIFDEDVSKYRNKTTLTMPAVTEGSVVEYQYTLRSPFVTSIDEAPLQYTIPINRLEAHFGIPEFLGFRNHFNLKSPLSFPIVEGKQPFSYTVSESVRSGRETVSRTVYTERKEFIQNVYTIEQNDIPALKEEAYVDYLKNYAAFLKWELQYTKFPDEMIENFSNTWEGVTKSIYTDGGYEKELETENYFRNDLDVILEGIQNPQDKALAIYNFVKAKVKWNDYLGYLPESGGRKAYKEGVGNIGDINIMLTAMLKYAGLKAHPVLVSTQNNGIPVFPTRSGFNYVIVALQLPNATLLLDATDKTAAMGQLPERARNWQGRIILDKETSGWVDLMPKEKSAKRTVLNVQFQEDFAVKGKSTEIYNGLYAKSFRDNYAELTEDTYLQYLESDKGNITVSSLNRENEDMIGEDLTQIFEFELQDEIEVINDRVYFQPMLFQALKENPFKADERTYPISFDFPSVTQNTVNIMIPEGYEVESLPESLIAELNGGAGSFQFLVHQNGKFLRIESVLDVNNIVFSSQDYEALKKFYGQMVDKQTEAIVLKKSS